MKVVEPPMTTQEPTTVHPTAIIGPHVELGPGVRVGPFAIIEGEVHIGSGTIIESHARIQGPTEIGCYNKIRAYSSIGCATQDKKFRGGVSRLIIGDHNDIREYATISRGSDDPDRLTLIGSHNLLMAYVHVAHDCRIGSHNTLANSASLAGNVEVGDYVGLGGFTGAHQFTRIGSYAFSGGGSIITKDLPPYMLAGGSPVRLAGLNIVGLKRREFAPQEIQELKELYRKLFRQSHAIRDDAESLRQQPGLSSHAINLIDFIISSQRGLIR